MLTILGFFIGAARKHGPQPRRLRTRGSVHSRCKRLDLGRIESVSAVLIQRRKELGPFEPAHRGDALPDPLCDLRALPRFHTRERECAKLDRQGCDDLTSRLRARETARVHLRTLSRRFQVERATAIEVAIREEVCPGTAIARQTSVRPHAEPRDGIGCSPR
jgi:hypothetical protein